jgi:hypothetical protein
MDRKAMDNKVGAMATVNINTNGKKLQISTETRIVTV